MPSARVHEPLRTPPARRVGLLVAVVLASSPLARADITYLGEATISWDATDLSGQSQVLGDGPFHADRLGSIGSAIAFTGVGNTYLMMSDRGPMDGALDYQPRFHAFTIELAPGSSRPVTVHLVSTTVLHDDKGPYSGAAAAFDADADPGLDRRLDPEALRVCRDGSIYTADEYGPWIDRWSAAGAHLERLAPPDKYRVKKRGDAAMHELPPNNRRGRQSNRGFEGLALSPDESILWALPQGVLLQDGALDPANERIGRCVRLLELDLRSRATREYVYTLDAPELGLNELLALPGGRLLALEKDGKEGKKARVRKLYAIDLAGATDVSGVDALPSSPSDLDAAIKPVRKTLLLDLLDPRWGLAGSDMPEKVEGLALGPALPDGRVPLLVTSDNDFRDGQPTRIWVFLLGAKDLSPAP